MSSNIVVGRILANAAKAMERVEELERDSSNHFNEKRELASLGLTIEKERDALKKECAELRAKHEEVLQRERKLDVTLAFFRAEAAENKAEAVHNLVGSLFRNVEFRRSTLGNAPQHVSGGGDYTVTGGTVPVNEEVTEIAD